MKKEVFSRFKDDNELISIYQDIEDMDAVDTGLVYDVNEDHLILYKLSKDGNFDGLLLLKLEDIFRFDFDGKYEKLFKYSKTIDLRTNYDFDTNNDFIIEFLKHSKDNRKVISICIEDFPDTGISCIVEEWNDDVALLSVYNEYGEYDCKTYISIDNISSIYLDTGYEKEIDQLIN